MLKICITMTMIKKDIFKKIPDSLIKRNTLEKQIRERCSSLCKRLIADFEVIMCFPLFLYLLEYTKNFLYLEKYYMDFRRSICREHYDKLLNNKHDVEITLWVKLDLCV